MTRAATLGRTAFGIAVAAVLGVWAVAGAGEPPTAGGAPPVAAPAPAAGLDPMDPAALRMALLARMDAKVDAAAARGHLEARLTLDAVMPLPYLGIDAEAEGAGMKVTKVYAGTSAEAIGLKIGDLVLAVEGRETRSKADLGRAIRSGRVGAPIGVRWTRDGKDSTAQATLGQRPEEDEDEDEQFPGLGAPPSADKLPAVSLDFQADSLGVLPSALESVLGGHGRPGQFVVVEEGGQRVLRQSDGDATGIRFPMALVKGLEAVDVVVRVRFRYVGGAADRAAGVVVRLRDPANYLVARTNAAEDDLRIFRTVNGIRRTLPDGRAKVSTDDDRWHVLEVRAEGPKITATLDGTTSVTSYDTYLGRGRAGVWTKSDSRTDFDDLVVTPTRR